MSGILVGWAFQQQCGGPGEKFILVKLADQANDQGVCWPSIGSIAVHCEMSERSVQNHLRSLEDRGLIAIEPRTAGSGGSLSNMYRLARVQDLHPHPPQNLHPSPQPVHQGGANNSTVGVQRLHPKPHKKEEPSLEPSKEDSPTMSRRRVAGEFAEWWKVYPHKVGKGAAEAKFGIARRIAELDELLLGVRRYIESKPPDRPWCNPATWLHQTRWLDQPAPNGIGNGHDSYEPSRPSAPYSGFSEPDS